MKKYIVLIIASLFTFSKNLSAKDIKIKTGIEILKEEGFKSLEGKRVGLITNPTGVDNNLKSTIDLLHEANNVNLVALFAPEHGVRGNIHAGDHIKNNIDYKTGLPVYSLYGKTRKATPEMLQGIDLLIYDIQDIGCRSFTYISTMGLAMEAAAENNIEFMVLDRPNPLGGEKIEGPITEDNCISFVSQFKIPYIYGLTCGELAIYLNEEGHLKEKCNLKVIEMKGWKRKMSYRETGLQWIASSPHIPQMETAYFYPISGILGELGYLSIGVGYTLPFQLFAAQFIKAAEFAKALNSHNLPGVIFRPIYIEPFYATGKGEQLEGVQVHLMNYRKASLTVIQFIVILEIARLYPEHDVFKHANKKRFNMFDKVCGSKKIRELLVDKQPWDKVKTYWNKDVDIFRKEVKKYCLYK